ncbi:unnamed protein product, partial [Menidia menidia]
FVPESVREVSKACESLCRWVLAVYEACSVQHQLVGKQQLEVLAGKSRRRLHLALKCKDDAYKRLEDVKSQLQFIQKELEDQLLQLHTAEKLTREATTCAEQLVMQVRDWRAACLEADLFRQNVPGDAIILAAVMSYLGPFGPDVRRELMSKWRELCQTGSININPQDLRTSLFPNIDSEPISPSHGFPITVTEKMHLPISQILGMKEWQLENTQSDRLLVKLLLWGYRCEFVQHWPLLADTEQYLAMSCQNRLITGESAKLEEEIGFELVVCVDDLELLSKLDQAAEKEIHPSILAQVHVVDLSLSSEEIQGLMLTQLIQSQCRGLLMQHLQCQNYNQLLQHKLVMEEDNLMEFILQSDTLLLKDSDFLSRVVVHQEEMQKLQAERKQLGEELEYHESLLAAPRQLMRLAAALYEALQAVSCLSPAYYFSLHGFMSVMHEAFSVEGRPLVSHTTGKGAECMLPEIMNTMVLQLLVQYRPCLFKSHAAVLKLLVCLALLKHNQLCSEAERMAFLRGLDDTEHHVSAGKPFKFSDTASYTTSSIPSWIPPHVISELLCLEQIPAFRGLISSLCASPMQWHEYLHSPTTAVAGAVSCLSHSHLSLLQRALLWKTMIPNCLEELADILHDCLLCLSLKTERTEYPHTGNPETLSKYVEKYEGPIILTMSNLEEDLPTSITPLRLINQLADCVAKTNEVEVRVISVETMWNTGVILSVMDEASRDGHWLVFNNCQLLERWDGEVKTHLSQLTAPFKGEQHTKKEQLLIHPHFRLWFVTRENASHFIPGAVRICALHLVCDSPWDLREELCSSLQQVVSVSQHQCPSAVITRNTELILRCAIFHSLLLQRQTYKYLGCGRIYHWNQEDLFALVDAHISIASPCCNRTKALQFIAVNLVHGGHVMDSEDLKVVESIARTCFSTGSSILDSCLHILSNFQSNCDSFDLSGLLRLSEQCLEDTAEPVLLGFGVDVASEMTRINSHSIKLLLKASQNPLGYLRSFSTKHEQLAKLPPYRHAKERIEALKSHLTHKTNSTLEYEGTVSRSPLRDFLLAEWDDLTDSVSSLVSQLQQPVEHLLSVASVLKFTNLSQLERRAELLRAYLWDDIISDPPGAYRLSAFKNARAFLIAVMREAAQINYKYISDITLQFQVLPDIPYPGSLPQSAVYLCGLDLKGASWDTQEEALQEALSPQPFPMPLICVKAKVRSNMDRHHYETFEKFGNDTFLLHLDNGRA